MLDHFLGFVEFILGGLRLALGGLLFEAAAVETEQVHVGEGHDQKQPEGGHDGGAGPAPAGVEGEVSSQLGVGGCVLGLLNDVVGEGVVFSRADKEGGAEAVLEAQAVVDDDGGELAGGSGAPSEGGG